MKYFDWNQKKNELLKIEREVCFEDVVDAISQGKVLDAFQHPNQRKYPNQKVYVVEIRGYAYFVAYVEDNEKKFLKTIYPSREATKKYLVKDKIK